MSALISAQEFANRRQRLMQSVGSDAAVILPAAIHHRRNRDSEYRFRQHSNFYYLTGFAEPEAVIVLLPGRAEGEFVLFCRPRDREMEIWNGYRAGPEGAVANFGADQSFVIDELTQRLPELLAGRRQIHAPMGEHADFEQQLTTVLVGLRARSRAGVAAPVAW
ncbi:MAG: aminopeptidase P N-terminal domain-containing protein, partial [Moraxellaceae bacterium]|nr:aminopeptidase P N-terminal domain-containing protein [Moraxellaceae bacterium]